MLSGEARLIRDLTQNDKNWTLKVTGQMLYHLAAINHDVLAEKVSYVDKDGLVKEKMSIPQKYGDTAILYRALRKAGRVRKCETMEATLKKLVERK